MKTSEVIKDQYTRWQLLTFLLKENFEDEAPIAVINTGWTKRVLNNTPQLVESEIYSKLPLAISDEYDVDANDVEIIELVRNDQPLTEFNIECKIKGYEEIFKFTLMEMWTY